MKRFFIPGQVNQWVRAIFIQHIKMCVRRGATNIYADTDFISDINDMV